MHCSNDIKWELQCKEIVETLNYLGFSVELRPMHPFHRYLSLCMCLTLVLEGRFNKANLSALSL